MRKLTLAFALLGTLTLAGCPKGSGGGAAVTYDEETLATNPAANFHKGLSIVQTPDKKTGEVNYAEAYSYFAKAADLGGGAKASFNAGWTAERLGKISEAEGHYRKAYETDPALGARSLFSVAKWTGSRLLTLAARSLSTYTPVNLSLVNLPGSQDPPR